MWNAFATSSRKPCFEMKLSFIAVRFFLSVAWPTQTGRSDYRAHRRAVRPGRISERCRLVFGTHAWQRQMGGEQKLTGPDLAAGIALTDLRDGETLVGRAGGEAVLLARRGEEIFAIGATCTHYSGPLGEGLLVDGTVRCPWHHACFDLRTGAALRAPALNPIACYEVESKDGRVRVGARKPERQPPAFEAKAPARIVIVGAGAAGHAAAEMLRREGYRGQLTMIGADSAPPVDRPNLSKDYLAGNAPETWMPLRPAKFFAEHDIELMLAARVTSLDTKRKQIVLADGSTQSYDKLLLATGADPIKLDLRGGDLPHVHYL